jgi:predicted RND superfamily exporter protein
MIGNSNQGAFGRALESFVFGNRMLVLAFFAIVTAVMLYFAAQLRVDAGFKKQIPLDHEFMKTFIDYEVRSSAARTACWSP